MNGYRIPGPGKYRTRGGEEVEVSASGVHEYPWRYQGSSGNLFSVDVDGFQSSFRDPTHMDIVGPAIEPKTLRDEFAMAAPVEPQPWFKPVTAPRPERPNKEPIGNNGEAPTESQARELSEWLCDPCWDIEADPGYDIFSLWCRWARNDFATADAEWYQEWEKQRLIQWPYAWADAVLSARRQP